MISVHDLKAMIEHSPSHPTNLHRSGKGYRGKCPFCSSLAGFSVGPPPVYNCFACGAKGNAVTWQRNVEGQTLVIPQETQAEWRQRKLEEEAEAAIEQQLQAFLNRNPHFTEDWYLREFSY